MATKKKATRSKAAKKSGGSGKADLVEKPREASRRTKAFVMSQARRKAHEAARSAGTSLKRTEALKHAMTPKDPRVVRYLESQAYREARKVAMKALEEQKTEAVRQAFFPTRVR